LLLDDLRNQTVISEQMLGGTRKIFIYRTLPSRAIALIETDIHLFTYLLTGTSELVSTRTAIQNKLIIAFYVSQASIGHYATVER